MNSTQKEIFKKRFHEYYPILCNVAHAYIADKNDCEDIVQETFIALWNNEKDLSAEKDFRSYMVVSIRNNCISYLRKQRLETVSMEIAKHTAAVRHAADTEPFDPSEISQEEKLQHMLAILPPRCKEVFMMSKFCGMKYREIAEQLDITEKTVENHMGKAYRALREFVCNNPLLIFILILVSIFTNNQLR